MQLFDHVLPPVHQVKLGPIENFKPREVQVIAARGLSDAYRNGFRRPLVMASTGSGKTKLAAWLIHMSLSKNPNQRICFTVPRVSLLYQTKKEFEDFLKIDIGVIRGKEPVNFRLQVYVATIHTLGRRMENGEGLFKDLYFSTVYADERHLMFEWYDYIKCGFMVGLTATPYSKGLGKKCDTLIRTKTAYQTVEDGVITPLKIYYAKRKINREKLITTSTGEYSEESEKLEANEMIGDVYQEWLDSDETTGQQFIAMCRSIDTCEKLGEIFTENGVKVGVIHSKMSDDDCAGILNLHKEGIIQGLISVNKLVEGWDSKITSVLLLCTAFAPSKYDKQVPSSKNRWIQSAGRVRRAFNPLQDAFESAKESPLESVLITKESNLEELKSLSNGILVDVDDQKYDRKKYNVIMIPDIHKKEYGVIMDFGDNYRKFLHPDEIDASFDELDNGEKKKKKKKNEETNTSKECPSCHAIFYKGNVCPYCSFKIEKHTEIINGEEILFINGKMVEVLNTLKAKNKKLSGELTLAQKRDIYAGVLYNFNQTNIRRMQRGDRPISRGSIAHRYKAITGVFPKNMGNVLPKQSKKVDSHIKSQQIAYSKSKKRVAR